MTTGEAREVGGDVVVSGRHRNIVERLGGGGTEEEQKIRF